MRARASTPQGRGTATLHTLPVPKMGKSANGVVFGWAKKPGDKIKVGDILCHIERDTVTDDIRSPVAGVLVERCASEEETVQPGINLAIIQTGGMEENAAPHSQRGAITPGQAAALLKQYQDVNLLRAAAVSSIVQQAASSAPAAASYEDWQAPVARLPESTASIVSGTLGMPSPMPDFSRTLPSSSTLTAMLSAATMAAQKTNIAKPKPAAPGPFVIPQSEMQRLILGRPTGAQGSTAPRDLWRETATTTSCPMPQSSLTDQSAQRSMAGWAGSIVNAASPATIAAKKAALSNISYDPKALLAAATRVPEAAIPKVDLEKLRCHLHKKNYNACKFCKKYLEAKKEADDEANAAKIARKASGLASESSFNCSPLLKERVVSCSYYKSLFALEDVDGLIQEIKQFATDTLDVYYRASVEPSCFMCCVYRLFTLSISEEKLRSVIDNDDSVIARCVGLLYIRYVVPPDQLWEKLEEFVLDDEELKDYPEGRPDVVLPKTIGEYVEELLLKDKYFDTPLPRIPAGVRRKLEESLAPMWQYRKRNIANRKAFGSQYRPRMSVEVFNAGHWRQGRALEVVRHVPSRVMVRVQLEEGPELMVHIGKVVVIEKERSRSRGRSRSRSHERQRGGSPDWSRFRGKADTECVEELRERTREDAVCGDRRGYVKRLPRFESGLAMNREKGREESKLIADDTFITAGGRRRENTYPELEDDGFHPMARRSEEDEARQRRMKELFEKYGAQKKTEPGEGGGMNDIDAPDVMRLG